jgi:hypothetical protein
LRHKPAGAIGHAFNFAELDAQRSEQKISHTEERPFPDLPERVIFSWQVMTT